MPRRLQSWLFHLWVKFHPTVVDYISSLTTTEKVYEVLWLQGMARLNKDFGFTKELRIEDHEVNGSRGMHAQRFLCVWVDSSLVYKSSGMSFGTPPPDRPDAQVDLAPDTPATALGSCAKCKVSWKWVNGHSTEYSPGRGCFPLCENCWTDLTPHERLHYYRSLYLRWKADAEKHGYEDDHNWEDIESSVLAGK